jgi:hypothetical protein
MQPPPSCTARQSRQEEKHLKKVFLPGEMVLQQLSPLQEGTPMSSFLQRFAVLIAGVLQGFDRLVFRGKLCPLYAPEGMNKLLCANHVRYRDFKEYAAEVTAKVLAASLMSEARALGRFRYLNSGKIDKEAVAREFLPTPGGRSGLVCVLQCLEPCWTFDKGTSAKGELTIRGEPGRCSHLYHYYVHPQFGWMYVRLQTWFPFELQVGLNGREWLARQMKREQLGYGRSDNKFLWVQNWTRTQQLLDQQLQTDWVRELDALQQQVHPLHPQHLGRLPLKYNWTTFQNEWATDIVFREQNVLEPWFDRWVRQAALTYPSSDILRFLGHSPSMYRKGRHRIETSVHAQFEGKRLKHWVNANSLKLYTHANVLRVETTINNAEQIRVLRPKANDPEGPPHHRPMRRTVVDLPQRATYGQEVNGRYLQALSSTAETRTLQELAEPLTRRVAEPGRSPDKSPRYVRGLNPLAAADAQLLTAISDPKWMVHGLRNRDLVAVLYPTPPADDLERRRRSARATRLLRLLRGHKLLDKIPGTHRYHVGADARIRIQALLACRNANPDHLVTNAA